MYSREDIIKQLKDMKAPQDSVVVMHSAYSTVGGFEGGASVFLDTLIEYFTKEGGLFCVPAHTAGNWFLGKEITLDMKSSENDLGILSKIAVERPDGVRSENPMLSVVVFGERTRAEAFVKDDEYVTTLTAPNGCYGKLYQENGYVLLLGVGQEKNTFLHSVGEILELDDRMSNEEVTATVRRSSGEVVVRKLRLYHCEKTVDVSCRFPKYDIAFRYHGAVTDGFIGDAPTQLCSAVKMTDTVKLIFGNSNGEDPLGTEFPIPPKWFRKK